MRIKKVLELFVIVILLLAVSIAHAGVTGKISGQVIDRETGEGLPGANVVVKGTTLGASADINGNFFILNIPAGIYVVEATMIGYTPVEYKDVRVSIDLTTAINFNLSSTVLDLGQVVSIIAERPLIQKDVTASTKITTNEQIQSLPVTTVNQAIATSAGTQGQGNNLHVRGGRAGEVAFLVDGLSVEDPQNRFIGLNVGRSALSEMQIISGGFNAEYGNAQSGVILLSTQEGNKNQYSGRISYQTDYIGKTYMGESAEKFDMFEANIGGPEPITTYLLPQLGLTWPGFMTLFVNGESRLTDGMGFHQDARIAASEPRFLQTSNQFRQQTIFNQLIGIGDNREAVNNSWDSKLVWQMSPNRKLTFGWRGNNDASNVWDFAMGLDLKDAVARAHQLGISDGIDNDNDGRIDEELINGVDDDGDGRIDEDTVLDRRGIAGIATEYDFAWGIDNDGDGRIDEEAYNGIDDDGDGRIDEDLQPYEWNGYDRHRRAEFQANQFIVTWSHTVSPRTFYEVRAGRFYTFRGTIPNIGKDGVSRSSFDELDAWLVDYQKAQAEIERARAAGEAVPDIASLLEPYRGFGFPSEPFQDANANGRYDAGEQFTDWDGDGMWDFNFGRGNPTWNFTGVDHPFRGQRFNGAYWSTFGGGRSGFAKSVSTTYFLKMDLTSQLGQNHEIKGGLEANYFDLENVNRQILTPYNGLGLFPNSYRVYPNWQAGYIQDKMEFKSAIVNLGFRVERFDQGEQVAKADTSNPGIARFEPPRDKWSLLPRLGFSFPVTEKDMFFFNYGRFFQRPQLTNVYTQVNQIFGSSNSIIGNPNLDPEQTTQYEFGIRHQFGLNTLLTVTGFFKDIENLMQINKEFDQIGNTYYTYFNDTYGTVKGFELQFMQRAGRFFSGEGSYTFQVAKATHSTARDTYGSESIFAQLPGVEYPADWDMRHKIVFHLDYHYGKGDGPKIAGIRPLENWNLSVLAQMNSGLPYTPESVTGTPLYEQTNTERYPWRYNIDLRMRRYFDISKKMRVGAMLEVLNVLNRKNAIGVDDGGIIDAYRNRIGFLNAATPTGTRNYGGYDNAVADPSAWDDGRKVRLGLWFEF